MPHMLIGAHLRIQSDFSLEETARILGEALDVSLVFDDSGYFEEFPAFFGTAGENSFALLGPPKPDYIVGAPYQDYQFDVMPLARDPKPDLSLGVEVQRRIVADGRLRSELL